MISPFTSTNVSPCLHLLGPGHFLVLVWVPVPQVVEHPDHSDHSPSSPVKSIVFNHNTIPLVTCNTLLNILGFVGQGRFEEHNISDIHNMLDIDERTDFFFAF